MLFVKNERCEPRFWCDLTEKYDICLTLVRGLIIIANMKKINKPRIIAVAARLGNNVRSISSKREIKVARSIIRSFILTILISLGLVAGVLANSRSTMLADETRYPAEITVTDGDNTQTYLTYQNTVIEAIDEAGIKVGENDLLSLSDDQQLLPGHRYDLSVSRQSSVTLSWSGYAISTAAEEMSMVDLLSRSGFSEISEETGTILEEAGESEDSVDGAAITYVNVETKEFREFEAIPYTTVEVDDPNIYEGESKVTTEGKDGQRATIYTDTYEDGIFVSRVYVGTEIVEAPVQKVIANGTKKKPVIAPVSRYANSTVVNNLNAIKSSFNNNGQRTYGGYADNGDGTITVDGQTYTYQDKQTRTVTMYDGLEVCMQQGCHSPAINHNTFSGVPAQRGIVATYGYKSGGRYTGSNLPLGSVLFIEGYGLAVVGDIHGVSSNPNLLDLSYDPGEIRAGTARVGRESRAVYILSTP